MAAKRNTTNTSALGLFLEELKAACELAGITKSEELAERLGYSASLVRMVQSGHRIPQPAFAMQCDRVFKTAGFDDSADPPSPGTFMRLEKRLRDLPFPASYRPFVNHEKSARQLRLFEITLVPGLLQTQEYARVVLQARPHITDDEVENLLDARLARQEVLTGDGAPLLYALLDEAALHRQVGSAQVMYDQLSHLRGVSHRPNVVLQVIPYSVGVHIGLQGAFVIADAPDGGTTVFADNIADGQTSEDAETVALVVQRFEALRADALPREASRELITKVADEVWTR